MSEVPKKPARWSFRIVGLLIGLLLAFVFAEAILAFLPPPPKLRSMRLLTCSDRNSEAYFCYDSNPNGEFQKLPDMSEGYWSFSENASPHDRLPDRFMAKEADETPFCVPVHASLVGGFTLRDWKYEPEIPPGKVRIALLGDSFVFGQGVPLDKLMSRQLNAELGEEYQVLNAGVLGAGTHVELEILDALRHETQFQSVVAVFIPNDVDLSPELWEQQDFINDFINVRESAWKKSGRWYAGHSRVLELVGSAIDMRIIESQTRNWYRDMYDPAKNKLMLDQLADDFKRLAEKPYPVALVICPLIESLSNYPFTDIHKQVAGMATEAGLPVLDITPELAKYPTVELQVHPSDHHPNGKAQKIIAEAIAKWLKSDQPEILNPPPALPILPKPEPKEVDVPEGFTPLPEGLSLPEPVEQ